MSMIFFTYRARLQARQAQALLGERGIPARLDRTPSQIPGRGCGYGLWVAPQRSRKAAELLRSQGPTFQRAYHFDGGKAQEVAL